MGWQDFVVLGVVFAALLHLLNLARRALFGGGSSCASGCGKCPSSRGNVIARLQQASRGPRAAAPIGPILTIAPPPKKGGPSAAR